MRARVERFGEPALLLLVSAGPTHGYELLEALPELIGDERVDVGNVYRTLRAFEDEGLVASEWKADLPGPTKRTYTLTPAGQADAGRVNHMRDFGSAVLIGGESGLFVATAAPGCGGP